MHLGQHDIGFRLGEKAAAFYRRELSRIAKNENRRAKGQQVLAELLVDHGTLVNDDQPGGCRGAVPLDCKLRSGVVVIVVQLLFFLGRARTIDQRMDRAGILAAFLPKDVGGLSGKRTEADIPVDILGKMTRQGCLAGPGVTEETENLPVAALEPSRGFVECVVLLRGPGHRCAPENCGPGCLT